MHGEIKINDVVFGTWAASRKTSAQTEAFDVIGWYDCALEWRDNQGYLNDAVWTMQHSPTQGPLAAQVIQQGFKRMKRRTYSD